MDLNSYVLFFIITDSALPLNVLNFINEPQDTLVPKNDVSKVICNVDHDNVKYSWLIFNDHLMDDQPITHNQYTFVDNNDVLNLKHHPMIVGRYRCKAVIVNIGTVISRLFRVDIADMYTDKVSKKLLGNGQYKIGDIAILICPFWTIPHSEARYRWFMKSGKGDGLVKVSTDIIRHHNGKMLELKVKKQSFGSYYCKTTYTKYDIEQTSPNIDVSPISSSDAQKTPNHLILITKPVESLILERNTFYSDELKVVDGKRTLINREYTRRLELMCAANSLDNEVDIKWLKDGTVIDRVAIQMDKFKYEIIGQGTLVLINTTRQYSGQYTCTAALRDGSKQIQTSVKLVVKPKLRFTMRPAPIVIGEVNKEMSLSCQINNAETQSTISWRKNGEVISPNSYSQLSNGVIRISRLLISDEGIFQCLADDEFSSLQAIVQMKINKAQSHTKSDIRPLPVQNLRVRAISYGTLNISWNHAAEGFDNILHYEITLHDLSDLSLDNPKVSLKADRLESFVLVKNLMPDSFHRIYVSSVNGSGTSYPAIIKSSPRVLSKAPSVAPTKVIVLDIGSSIATVHWVELPKNKLKGQLLGYRVVVSSIDGIYSKSIDVLKKAQMLQILDLIPDTKYSIRIQALTRGGRGPFSDTVTFETSRSGNTHDVYPSRTQDPGKNNVQLSNEELQLQQPGEINNWRAKGLNNSIVLQWSHPNNGGTVNVYKIKWGKVYPGPSEVTVLYPSSSYIIDNLEMRTQYMIKIIPTNDAGDGQELLFSQFTNGVDNRKIPIPLNLGLKSVELDSAIISWEDPIIDVRNTRMYEVRYEALEKDVQSTSMKNTTENSVQITGLLSSTAYAFSVRTGILIVPSSAEHGSKEWIWSEWSLKETFITVGEKPTSSPQDIIIATSGTPYLRDNDIYTKIIVSWTPPSTKSSRAQDDIIGYTVFFTDNPQVDQKNWQSQVLLKDQFSYEISLRGRAKIYYFRIGCRTTHFQCPLSRIMLYKTADINGKNFGLLRIPENYYFSLDIPIKYLSANPINSLETKNPSPESLSRDMVWLLVGVIFGATVFLIMLTIVTCICCKRRSKLSLTGYKRARKSSNECIGTVGLLLSNQSPVMSNGKVCSNFLTGCNQQLKNPDRLNHSEKLFDDLENDSNPDNDSLPFTSVSQHHLATVTTCPSNFNPSNSNHSLLQFHPQIKFYPELAAHPKIGVNSTTLRNINNITIPSQVQDSNLQRLHNRNGIYPVPSQQLVTVSSIVPTCSSSYVQPVMMMKSNDDHRLTNHSNIPRVNASELPSNTSSEDIRPLILNSRVSDVNVGQYRSNVKEKINNSSKKSIRDSRMSSKVYKQKRLSSEELNEEMANLDGLMMDLKTITQKEFEC